MYVLLCVRAWSTSTKHLESRTMTWFWWMSLATFTRTTKPIDELQITQSACLCFKYSPKTAKFIKRSIKNASKLTIDQWGLLVPTVFDYVQGPTCVRIQPQSLSARVVLDCRVDYPRVNLLWGDKWNISYIELRIWNQVRHDHRSTQFKQLRTEAWKSQDFIGVWTRELAIPVRCSNQLNHEATDVGSWSFVSSNEPCLLYTSDAADE